MKYTPILLAILILLAGCQSVPTVAPAVDSVAPAVDFNIPPAPYLTPITVPPAIIGETTLPIRELDDNWHIVQNDDVGFSVQYPPDWQALIDENGQLILYPPGSAHDVPSAMVKFLWLDIQYIDGQPLFAESTDLTPLLIAGVEGQFYQDGQFALPVQNIYVEIPHRDGILLATATIGPNVNLRPQLEQILITLAWLGSAGMQDDPAVAETSVSSGVAWQNSGIYVDAGTILEIVRIDGQWTDWKGTNPYTNGVGDTRYICANMMAPASCVEPLPQAPRGSLIGKIGSWSFLIGNKRILTAEQTGYLHLRINDGDDGLFDNDGELVVQIILSP